VSIRALIACVGKAGTGKSFKLRQVAKPCRRLLVADPDGSWETEPGSVEIESARELILYVRAQQLADPARPFRIVYRDDAARLAAAAGGVAFTLQHCTLLIDEIAWCCKPSYMPPELLRAIQFGRRRRINLLYTTREPQEVHNLLFTQCNLGYFFRVEPGLGLDRLRRWYPAIAPKLPALAEFAPPAQFRTYGNPHLLKLLGREGRVDLSARKVVSSRRPIRPDAPAE
jgi:hypothetical protein